MFSFLIGVAAVIGALAVVLLPVVLVAYQAKQIDNKMSAVASAFTGHVVPRGLCQIPMVVFRREGCHFQVAVNQAKTGNEADRLVFITGPWPVSHTRLSVFPETFWTQTQKFIGMQDLQIGNPQFDNVFVLQSSDPMYLAEVLNHDAQQILLNIRAYHDLNLNVFNGVYQLGITIDRFEARKIIELVSAYLTLRNYSMRTLKAHPIYEAEIADPVLHLANIKEQLANCLVCGTEVVDDRVHCQKCKTPHHKECWGYFGGCSRYGCGSTRYK